MELENVLYASCGLYVTNLMMIIHDVYYILTIFHHLSLRILSVGNLGDSSFQLFVMNGNVFYFCGPLHKDFVDVEVFILEFFI